MLPQLLVGLLTLILLAAAYMVLKQRQLNRMRDFILATHRGAIQLPAMQFQDKLTGLIDRRGLVEILELEASRAGRYGSPFSIVHCDIRHFHKINEREGNLAGDQVLQEVARILRVTVRKTDIVVRYGGDEFLCVLPATDPRGGEIFIHRAGERLKSSARLQGLTVDMGMAMHRPETNLDALLAEAEKDTERKRAGAPQGPD
jgi:diguanylate cyclase (GGDEF)-like protein